MTEKLNSNFLRAFATIKYNIHTNEIIFFDLYASRLFPQLQLGSAITTIMYPPSSIDVLTQSVHTCGLAKGVDNIGNALYFNFIKEDRLFERTLFIKSVSSMVYYDKSLKRKYHCIDSEVCTISINRFGTIDHMLEPVFLDKYQQEDIIGRSIMKFIYNRDIPKFCKSINKLLHQRSSRELYNCNTSVTVRWLLEPENDLDDIKSTKQLRKSPSTASIHSQKSTTSSISSTSTDPYLKAFRAPCSDKFCWVQIIVHLSKSNTTQQAEFDVPDNGETFNCFIRTLNNSDSQVYEDESSWINYGLQVVSNIVVGIYDIALLIFAGSWNLTGELIDWVVVPNYGELELQKTNKEGVYKNVDGWTLKKIWSWFYFYFGNKD